AAEALTALGRGMAILETLAQVKAPDKDVAWLAAQLSRGSQMVSSAVSALGQAAQVIGDKNFQIGIRTIAGQLSVLSKLAAQVGR
ncbi:MAG: hypothetical protein M3024_13665, partial [Candidatus Dormibacteraeota bacterium]|nr:hypothetical protein [Candidatus Dormibacteraeota bacterium]